MAKDDIKPYHMAALMSERGVSALCFDRPRAINLKRALWTIRWEAVTCKKCLARRPQSEVAEVMHTSPDERWSRRKVTR